jgi:hypothetical protein
MNQTPNAETLKAETLKADFTEARETQWVHKPDAMKRMMVAVCELAIDRAGQEFSANDVPLESHGGQGVCGSIFKRLAKDEVIARVGSFDGAANFIPKYVTNAGGNPVKVWRLKSYSRALRLIVLHSSGSATGNLEFKQAEFLVS